jgi:hypothetical protein
MTREEFIEVLDEKGYSYEIVRNKIIVTDKGDVYLDRLTSLPPGVEFKNGGTVYLNSLTSLPPGVEFNNKEYVYLLGRWFHRGEGNIEGIDSKRLLSLMTKPGMFI